MKFPHAIAIAAALFTFAASAQAQASSTEPATQQAQATAAKAQGEVRKVDKAQGKVTLKHGPIATLEMPGMTMVFKVADPKMLEGVKEGDKVTFAAERVNGTITVTSIEAAR